MFLEARGNYGDTINMPTINKAVTLQRALDDFDREHWNGLRSRRSSFCQINRAIDTLSTLGASLAIEVTPEVASRAVTAWQAEGLSPRSINYRVSVLRKLGVAEIKGVRRIRHQKWWLRPEDRAELTRWLPTQGRHGAELHDLIEWTCLTGLRIEESLRVERRHFMDLLTRQPHLTIPGTKTARAGNVTLRIALPAAEIAARRLGLVATNMSQRLFPSGYRTMCITWQKAREHLGVSDVPTATLRALRRTAARHLHVEIGMPLDMVRDYLRHEDISTTQEYLRLTGGYSREVGKWLDGTGGTSPK